MIGKACVIIVDVVDAAFKTISKWAVILSLLAMAAN